MPLRVGNFCRANSLPHASCCSTGLAAAAGMMLLCSGASSRLTVYSLDRVDALERTELRLKRLLDFGLMALLLTGAAIQTGCGNTAEPPMNARKYWDRCLGAQCPPMDETDARKK
jgi:hypothetical protein